MKELNTTTFSHLKNKWKNIKGNPHDSIASCLQSSKSTCTYTSVCAFKICVDDKSQRNDF